MSIEKLREALERLVALHDGFMQAQGGFMGNQADAYDRIAKHFDAWDAARQALASIPVNKDEVVCADCGRSREEHVRNRHMCDAFVPLATPSDQPAAEPHPVARFDLGIGDHPGDGVEDAADQPGWQPISNHSGYEAVVVCRAAVPQRAAIRAFRGIDGEWRALLPDGTSERLRFTPTHFRLDLEMPGDAPQPSDEQVEWLAAILCDSPEARLMAKAEREPDFSESSPHVQAYWRSVAKVALTALRSPVPRELREALERIAAMTDTDADFDGAQARRIAQDALATPAPVAAGEGMVHCANNLPAFDAGLLGDGGGGDVSWWQDYIRSLLEQADHHYREHVAAAQSLVSEAVEIERLRDGWLPIETAPEGDEDSGPFFDVTWAGESHRYLPRPRRAIDCFRQGATVLVKHGYPSVLTIFNPQPTHWRPAPAALGLTVLERG